MIWVAFSLGLFGSLHCLGMCGPLAMGFAGFGSTKNRVGIVFHSIFYNLGRVLSYMVLGFAFGLLSSAATLSGIQNALSVLAGCVLILLFFLSLDLERVFGRSFLYQKFTVLVQKKLSNLFKKHSPNPLIFGLINGFLPCGMVYLALTGALTAGSVFYSIAFMFFFGLGTFPALFALMVSPGFISWRTKIPFSKILPVIGFALGLYLIWRGLVFDLPMVLDVHFLPEFLCH